MIVYFEPTCPYCVELSLTMTGRLRRDFSGIPGLTPILRSDPEYAKEKSRLNYSTVPMLVTTSGKCLGGYDANNNLIQRHGIQDFLTMYDK